VVVPAYLHARLVGGCGRSPPRSGILSITIAALAPPVIAAPVRSVPALPATAHLTTEDLEAFGRELDRIRSDVVARLGKRDADYIRNLIKAQRWLELAGRASLLFSKRRPAFFAGTTLLTLSKILENMEIGHNVLHGQYDWLNDPTICSQSWEWDAVSTADSWR
jgi:fatty acid desaturase